ncbi:protein windpipe [Epargyreus clarus]|uniref:protein windpipe n=1 Tax=Epargyreus clarus TaxID=520877 RepID=UPI003C2D73DD
MACLSVNACLLALTFLFAPSLATICPDHCVCSTTRDGLHRVTCSNLAELYKYTLRQKHHNINILDLSHNNITKVNHELDRLTELVTLDLSTNGITDLNKFLQNARKLVHVNLANNRIAKLSFTHLPTSVSSLDLTNNLLHDVPSNLGHLVNLEHLELDGNPLDCTCENLVARDRFLVSNVHIDSAKCETPAKLKGRSWLELKTKDICKASKMEINYLDMMMGDQPIDAVRIGKETTALKSMALVASNDLDEGNVIRVADQGEDDDSMQFMKVGRYTTSFPLIDGSGDAESTTISDVLEPIVERKMYKNILAEESVIPAADIVHTTEDPIEGSGEGSGFGFHGIGDEYDFNTEPAVETTTPIYEELNPGPVRKIFVDDDSTTSEFPIPKPPSIYEGGSDWHSKIEPDIVTQKAVTQEVSRDTTVSEQIRVTHASEVLGQAPTGDEKVTHKTGTYVCIALIVVLLVGLIGFAIIKGQMRKRRDRRLLRQQKRDVEKASKEMVDMNKSLLGKPALSDTPTDRIVNGKYELVPTHESHQKKGENGLGNGVKHNEENNVRTDSPRDTNQNKRSSIDNNLAEDIEIPQQETSFESDPTSPDSRKDRHSLSSEDIFVPAHDDEIPRLNGNTESDVSHPLINGDQTIDSDFLSPSREYVPVYSPDMGRVRIKMSETPKPKTPVLVTRSRSNAGDIIITPAMDANVRKSTT